MKHDRVAVTPTTSLAHSDQASTFLLSDLVGGPTLSQSESRSALLISPFPFQQPKHTTTGRPTHIAGNRCIQQQRASGTRTQTPRTLCAPSAPPPTHRNGYPAARLSRRAVGSAPRHQAASGAGSHSPRPPRARSTHNLLSAGPGALAHRMRHRHTGTPASFLPHALIRRARERGTARLDNGRKP